MGLRHLVAAGRRKDQLTDVELWDDDVASVTTHLDDDDVLVSHTNIQFVSNRFVIVLSQDDVDSIVMVEKKWSIKGFEMKDYLLPKITDYLVTADIEDITAAIFRIDRPELNDQIVELLIIEGTARNVRAHQEK